MATNNNSDRTSRMSMHNSKDTPPARTWLKVLKWTFLGLLIVLVSGVGLFAYYAKSAPSISIEQLQSGGTSGLYTNNGKFLMNLGSEKRTYVKNANIPDQLKNAIVSVEDKRFYSEKLGIDPVRIVGSMLSNAQSNSIAAGGSTITQQLVKLTVFSTAASQRTLKRKAQEAWLAMKVQHDYSKNQILEFYINKVYMNYGNYGMGTAARFYYGKQLKELDLAQTALIAGMPNAPVTFNPYLNPDKAKYRRDIVLQAMYDNNKISKVQMQQAMAEPITQGLVPMKPTAESRTRKINDPYLKEVINEVREKGFDPYNDNLKITVNINQAAQTKLYDLVNNGNIPFSSDKMQVGATVVDPDNGHVIAIIGGRHLPDVQLGLDRAVQTSRSTGSSVKPVLDYAPAIEFLNWSTAHILDDSKYVYPGTHVQLYDWDNRYMGNMSMRYALEQSRNVPAVKTLSRVGLNRASKFAGQMGVNVPVHSGAGLSVAIGANASSLQMAGAFGAFATEGVYHKPQFVSKIETPDGLVRNYDDPGTRVMKKSTAYMITDMLKGVLTKGSGTQAKIPGLYEAGKTGTVKYSDQDLAKYPSYQGTPKDAWFVGYTKSYSMGVWTGYDNLKDGTITGQGQYAAQILYKEMMSYLMQDKDNSNWEKPSSVIRVKSELYVRGHAPAGAVDDSDYDSADEQSDTNIDNNSDDFSQSENTGTSTTNSDTSTDNSNNISSNDNSKSEENTKQSNATPPTTPNENKNPTGNGQTTTPTTPPPATGTNNQNTGKTGQ